MSQVSATLRRAECGFEHWCPGCEEMHVLPDGWTFNGDVDRPTFSPSFKHTGVRCTFVDGKWTGEWPRDAQGKPIPMVCHYILTAGQLNFCGDSTHPLAGTTVPLPPLPAGLQDP